MNNYRIIFAILLLFSFAHSASFDCRKASNWIENTICSDTELSNLDSRLGYLHGKVKNSITSPYYASQFKKESRRWLKKRNHCRNSSCIRQQYYYRITQLQKMMPNKTTHNSASDGTFKVNQVTWGACMTICEDASFCKNADHNSNSGVCTLYLNSNHPQYLKLQHTCPKKYWHAVYGNEKWHIVCAF